MYFLLIYFFFYYIFFNCISPPSSEGQKIAKKLSQQLSKETSSIKCLLDEYNGRCATSKAYDFLTMSEALSKGVIEGRLQGLGTSYSSIATGSKREIIDAYLMLTRVMEEIQMLQKEIENMLNYYSRREKCILLKLTELSDDQHRRLLEELLAC